MSDFRRLSDTVLASPQITLDDIEAAKADGVTLIINNRPDDEEPGQLTGATIEQAAVAAGLAYLAIPIGQSGFSHPQIAAMSEALAKTEGKVLAYCRSGTRSTFLWSLAQASQGVDPGSIADSAQIAGYDVSPVRPAMDMLATKAVWR